METFYTILVTMTLLLGYGYGQLHTGWGHSCPDLKENLHRNLTITSDFDVGSTVYSFAMNYTTNKCDVYEMIPHSVFFMLEHNKVQDVWNLKVKACLVAGTEHIIRFAVSRPDTICIGKKPYINVVVLPTIPKFNVSTDVNMYYVTECEKQSLKLVVAITSSSKCVSLTCSVGTLNSENIFMVKDECRTLTFSLSWNVENAELYRTAPGKGQNIYAYVDKISFRTIYMVTVACIEIGTDKYEYSDQFQVSYIDKRNCVSTPPVPRNSTEVMALNRTVASADAICKSETHDTVTVEQTPGESGCADIAVVLVLVKVTILLTGAIIIGVGYLLCRQHCKSRTTRPTGDNIHLPSRRS